MFFNECPHPDDKQRKELGHRLGLEPIQVKFWFQNKRTQMKLYSVSQENSHSSSGIESSLFALLGDEDRSVAANAGGFTNTFDHQSMFTDDLMEEILQLKASILCNDELQNEGMLIRPKEGDEDSCKKRPRQAEECRGEEGEERC